MKKVAKGKGEAGPARRRLRTLAGKTSTIAGSGPEERSFIRVGSNRNRSTRHISHSSSPIRTHPLDPTAPLRPDHDQMKPLSPPSLSLSLLQTVAPIFREHRRTFYRTYLFSPPFLRNSAGSARAVRIEWRSGFIHHSEIKRRASVIRPRSINTHSVTVFHDVRAIPRF